MIKILVSLLFINFLLISCKSQVTIFYNLNLPNKKLELPPILNEISGLTDIDSTHVACVQDEIGTVFIYNFIIDSIIAEHRFDSVGDFEGLTYTGKTLFILRSDGRFTEWKNFNSQTGAGKIAHSKLSLLTANNEGLCFDKKNNRLLIAAKSKPINHDSESERFIYEFNLSKKQLKNKPVYSINTDELGIIAEKFNIQQHSVSEKGKIKPFNFRPSSIAVHPHTSDIYVISAADKLLLIMDTDGKILHIEQLNPDLFAKAEGITFLHDGTMIITNEAAGNVPTLLIYEQKN